MKDEVEQDKEPAAPVALKVAAFPVYLDIDIITTQLSL